MAERRFYWLKLPEDFFQDKRIKKLRRLAGGDTFTVIYLKMLLHTMQSDGKLFFDGLESNIADEIALEIDEDEENVSLTINYLISVGLAEMGTDEVVMTDLPRMVGSETSAAIRKRRSRENALIESRRDNVTQACDQVTPMSQSVTQSKSREEKEIDKEREIECVRTPIASLGSQVLYDDEYSSLCEQIGKKYVDATIKRIVETPYKGCLTVNKISTWALESRTKEIVRKGSNRFNNYQQRDIDYDALLTGIQESMKVED